MQQCNSCTCTSARQHKPWTIIQLRTSSPYTAQQLLAVFASDNRTMAAVLHLVLLYLCSYVQQRGKYSGHRSMQQRVLFNQDRWSTLNNPASALYSVTYASRAARSLLQGTGRRKSPSARFRSSCVKYDYNRPSDRQKS